MSLCQLKRRRGAASTPLTPPPPGLRPGWHAPQRPHRIGCPTVSRVGPAGDDPARGEGGVLRPRTRPSILPRYHQHTDKQHYGALSAGRGSSSGRCRRRVLRQACRSARGPYRSPMATAPPPRARPAETERAEITHYQLFVFLPRSGLVRIGSWRLCWRMRKGHGAGRWGCRKECSASARVRW